jgi:uncharacterized protein (TIGR00369 family)
MIQRDDFHGLVGVILLEWREGYACAALDILPQHLNRSGIVHGGVLLTVLDEVGALSGVWCSVKGNRRSSVTVDLAGHFTAPAREGRLVATGECVSRGGSLYFTRSEIRDAGGRLISYGSSTHKWRRGSSAIEGMPAGSVRVIEPVADGGG